jgi:hypothetical protein
LALAAFSLVVLANLWPSPVAGVLHSRLGVLFIALWCGGLAIYLHPKLSAGLLQGFREMRKTTGEVLRDIFRDDDDDGPRGA